MNLIKNSILTLFLANTFSTVSYAVLYSSLSLYLTGVLKFDASHAYAVVAVFMVFNYGLHLLGSYLGGRLASYRVLYSVSMLLQIIACIVLIKTSVEFMYIGLTIFLVATGVNVPCINMMLTQRLQHDHQRREKAFLWNYAGSNLGFFFGYTSAGYFQLDQNYSMLFVVASVFNVIGFLIGILGWRFIADIETPLLDALKENGKEILVKTYLQLALVFVVLMGVIYLSLTHPFSLKQAVLVLTAALFAFFYWLSTKQKDQLKRKHIQTYLILAVFALLFWSMYYLAPMALTIFAEHNVNMGLLGFRLTPQWLGNINVVIITLGGFLLPPVFAKIRQKTAFTVPMQFSIGLLSIGIGFAFLPIGILLANTQSQSSVLWVSLFYCFQSFGELLLAPIGYSMIAQVAPVRHQGLMMGAWMLITGSTASVMSGYLSGSVIVSGNMSASATNGNYFVLFSVLFVLAILAAITLTFINKKMNLIENK